MIADYTRFVRAAEYDPDLGIWQFLSRRHGNLNYGNYGYIPWELFCRLTQFVLFEPETDMSLACKGYRTQEDAQAAVQRVIELPAAILPYQECTWEELPTCDDTCELTGILCGERAVLRVRYDQNPWIYLCSWHARVRKMRV